MLNQVIAKFLQISEEQAATLIGLMELEGRFQQPLEWKDQEKTLRIDPAEIKTQEQFITFVQMIGQTKYFKGHDRTQLPSDAQQVLTKDKYFSLFNNLGLIDEVKFAPAKKLTPAVSVVLGSSEPVVQQRLNTLISDLKENLVPTENTIYGLGTDSRELGKGVDPGSEQTSIDELKKLGKEGKELNESSMVDLLCETALKKLNQEHKGFEKLNYVSVNATSDAKNRAKGCATTAKTAEKMKELLQSEPSYQTRPKPIVVAAYSSQPFVIRQARDMQITLGDHFQVIGVGQKLKLKNFRNNDRAISICLKEIGSLVNINYRLNQNKLENNQTPLSEIELSELRKLNKPSKDENSELYHRAKLTESEQTVLDALEKTETANLEQAQPKSEAPKSQVPSDPKKAALSDTTILTSLSAASGPVSQAVTPAQKDQKEKEVKILGSIKTCVAENDLTPLPLVRTTASQIAPPTGSTEDPELQEALFRSFGAR